MQDLGDLGGGWSRASGVSADGSVVVGRANTANGDVHAFRWTADGGMQDLGTLGGIESEASGVSADGSVVVGGADNTSGQWCAFRWTAAGGMQDLGTLGGGWSAAYDVSADGSVVVGEADNTSGYERAFRWTAQSGMQDLNQLYAVLLQDGSDLLYAYAISPDGRYIVGVGRNAATGRGEAYLLDTWRRGDTNGDGCVDDSDLLAVLFAFGTPGTGQTRHEDINKDGIVDDADLLEVLFAFGQGC
jgi:probable HAF family extracellular repeat protein